MPHNTQKWQVIAADACSHRERTIAALRPPLPEIPGKLPCNRSGLAKLFLSPREVEITESFPENLLADIASRKLSCTEVTIAFLRRAGLASKLTNCLTELLPQRALERATFLDKYLEDHHKPIGPLHGLPISVKEHVGMKGLGLNAGFVDWIGRVAEDDALILKILWDAGCVFFARTTQPQSLMHLETSNNIFGVTTNAFNADLTSGGSSGGEGALVGFRGSCLGIGSDIGGSIRSPAGNNGVYGFKPTAHRLPSSGMAILMYGAESIAGSVGPLSTSLEGINIFMRTIIASRPWVRESALLPFPWREESEWFRKLDGKRRMKIAVLSDDGVVRPHPPVLRALEELVVKLKNKDGIEIVEWTPYRHDLAWNIISNLYFADGGAEEAAAIDASGEPWRPLTTWMLKENPNVRAHTIQSLWEAHVKRDHYRQKYDDLWNATATHSNLDDAVDLILCPMCPGAAPPHDSARYWGYTAQWNLLDYPALVFPVSKVDVNVDIKDETYVPRNKDDEYNQQLYDPERYRDAPISLQLVARRFEDEKVIQGLRWIEREVGGLPFEKYY